MPELMPRNDNKVPTFKGAMNVDASSTEISVNTAMKLPFKKMKNEFVYGVDFIGQS